ncbi:MAG: DUF4157 domain-containing protein, partial [Chloroflexota bacterium]|nr:DUF4157 domain-containing protein [Chloroflexota bacterium]
MAETQNKAPQSEKGQERRSRVEPFQDQQQKREMVFVPYEGFVGSLGAKDTLKRAKAPTTETQVSRKDDTSEFYDSLLGTSMINPETERHVAVLSDQRFSHPANSEPSSRIVNRMQQTYGNGYVQRVVDIVQENRADDLSEDVVSDDIEQRIHSKRGSGQPLENQTRRQMDNAFGHDFSNVNIHTDGSADSLAQALQAKAFTVGNDVFFREGAYQPDSESGKKLLGHELTHVIQQTPQASLNAILQRTCDEACRRRAGVLVGQMHTLFGNTQITDAVRRQAYSTFGADEMNADLAGEIVRQYDSHWGQPGFVADFMSFVRRVAEQSQRHPGQTVEEATNQLVEIWAADFYDAGITEIQQQYPIPRTIPFTQANLNRWRTQLVPSRYSGSGAGSQLNIAPLVMWISGFRWQT